VDGTEQSEPSTRQVSDDKPCNDPMIKLIVARLRHKRNLSVGMTCLHCFVINGHHTAGCHGLKEAFNISVKCGGVPPENADPPSTPGGSSARKASGHKEVKDSETKTEETAKGKPNSFAMLASIDEEDEEMFDIIDMFEQYESINTEDTDLVHAIPKVAARKAEDTQRGHDIDNYSNLAPKPISEKVVARMAKCDTKWLKDDTTVRETKRWDTQVKEDLAKLAQSSPVYSGPRTLCPDSGATSIMNPFRDMFINYKDTRDHQRYVRLGDENKRILIHGIGTMAVSVKGKTIVYDEVLHVPQLTAILLSTRVHQQSADGCSFVADSSGCFLTYPKFVVEVNGEEDCTIDCQKVDDSIVDYDFDSRLHVDQNSSGDAVRRCHALTFAQMLRSRHEQARLVITKDTATPIHPESIQAKELSVDGPRIPIYAVPNSGAATVERINTTELKRMFVC
jgi:hypothetical protein